VIADDRVALKYREILRTLDVPISEAKSHVSKDTYEFAKRWWHRGDEVTPFPLAGLVEIGSKYYLLPGFFRDLATRGFNVTPVLSDRPVVVRDLFASLIQMSGKANYRLITYLYQRYQLVLAIPLAGSSFDQVYDCAMRFRSLTGVYLSCN